MFVAGNFLSGVAFVLDWVLELYKWIIIIRVLISWVNPDPWNPIVQILHRLTDPVLLTIRRRIPFAIAGGIDLSPIIAILILYFLQIAVVGSMKDLAMQLH